MPGHRKWSQLRRPTGAHGSHRSVGDAPVYGRTVIAVRYDRAISDADALAVQASVQALVLEHLTAARSRSTLAAVIVQLVESHGYSATDVFENSGLIEVVVRTT